MTCSVQTPVSTYTCMARDNHIIKEEPKKVKGRLLVKARASGKGRVTVQSVWA